jgi:hypothetical protein
LTQLNNTNIIDKSGFLNTPNITEFSLQQALNLYSEQLTRLAKMERLISFNGRGELMEQSQP